MALEHEDIERLKSMFVSREDCESKTSEINDRLADDSKELALLNQKLDTITWVSKTTLGAVIVAIVGAIMALILR